MSVQFPRRHERAKPAAATKAARFLHSDRLPRVTAALHIISPTNTGRAAFSQCKPNNARQDGSRDTISISRYSLERGSSDFINALSNHSSSEILAPWNGA